MRKTFLTLFYAALFLAAGSLLSSCSKNDDNNTPKEETETYVDVTFCTAVLDSQLPYIDHKFELKVNGIAKTVALDTMTVANNSPIKSHVDKVLALDYTTDSTKWPKHTLYKTTFPVKKGSTVVFVKSAFTAKGKAPELIDVMHAYLIGPTKKMAMALGGASMHKELYGDKLQSALDLLNKEENVTITAE